VRTFNELKQFFRQYGRGIGYTFDDLLHWYFSNVQEPTKEEIRTEVLRRLAQRNIPDMNRAKRKDWYQLRERTLRNQLASLTERLDILESDRRLGISAEESLALVPLRLTAIRSLRDANPSRRISEMWVCVGDLAS